MKMTFRGKYRDRDVEILWEDGKLSGDEQTVKAIETEAKLRTGWMVGPPTGPFTSEDHLNSPISAAILASELLEGFSVPDEPDWDWGAPDDAVF